MHEFGIATQILSCVEETAANHAAEKVTALRVRVGRLSGFDRDSLAFCLGAISAGTILEGAALEFIDSGPMVACPSCGRFPAPKDVQARCPECGGEADILSETGLYIEEMELDVEADQS